MHGHVLIDMLDEDPTDKCVAAAVKGKLCDGSSKEDTCEGTEVCTQLTTAVACCSDTTCTFVKCKPDDDQYTCHLISQIDTHCDKMKSSDNMCQDMNDCEEKKADTCCALVREETPVCAWMTGCKDKAPTDKCVAAAVKDEVCDGTSKTDTCEGTEVCTQLVDCCSDTTCTFVKCKPDDGQYTCHLISQIETHCNGRKPSENMCEGDKTCEAKNMPTCCTEGDDTVPACVWIADCQTGKCIYKDSLDIKCNGSTSDCDGVKACSEKQKMDTCCSEDTKCGWVANCTKKEEDKCGLGNSLNHLCEGQDRPNDVCKNPVTTTSVPITTSEPVTCGRKFDAWSFVGGALLVAGIFTITYVGFRFYKKRTEARYHQF